MHFYLKLIWNNNLDVKIDNAVKHNFFLAPRLLVAMHYFQLISVGMRAPWRKLMLIQALLNCNIHKHYTKCKSNSNYGLLPAYNFSIAIRTHICMQKAMFALMQTKHVGSSDDFLLDSFVHNFCNGADKNWLHVNLLSIYHVKSEYCQAVLVCISSCAIEKSNELAYFSVLYYCCLCDFKIYSVCLVYSCLIYFVCKLQQWLFDSQWSKL